MQGVCYMCLPRVCVVVLVEKMEKRRMGDEEIDRGE